MPNTPAPANQSRRVFPALSIATAVLTLSVWANAQVSLPQVNLGQTSFQDAIAFPGWLLEEIPGYYHATEWKDSQGNDISGANSANSISSLSHVAYVSKHRIFGGFYTAEVLVPIADVHLNTSFGPRYRTRGIGDLIVGPFALQWTDMKLHGRPFFQRVMLDVFLPTGKYSDRRPVNVGNNVVSVNPYYAFTFVATDKLEFSGRLHYLWNSENSDPFIGLGAKSIQAGQAFHQNFAVSYKLRDAVRVGLNGYALEQITDHKLNGNSLPNSREQAFALGPGVEIQAAKGLFIYMNSYFETDVRNRPQGATYILRLSKVIGTPPKDK